MERRAVCPVKQKNSSKKRAHACAPALRPPHACFFAPQEVVLMTARVEHMSQVYMVLMW